jgi:hypothetical protein
MNRTTTLLLALSVFAMNQSSAQSQTRAPSAGSVEYLAIVEHARAQAAQELKLKVELKPDVLKVSEPWAFITAQLVDASGAPFKYEGTPLEAAAAAGGVSRLYAGLLKRDGEKWRVVTQAIGPTDVVWETWPQEFAAPRELFGM